MLVLLLFKCKTDLIQSDNKVNMRFECTASATLLSDELSSKPQYHIVNDYFFMQTHQKYFNDYFTNIGPYMAAKIRYIMLSYTLQ